MTKHTTLWPALAAGLALTASGTAQKLDEDPVFAAPKRLTAGGKLVQVESPGYAFPAWADVDGDGKKDLVVGQFSKGKMKVFLNLGRHKLSGENRLAEGRWLEVEGKVAEVPGVW